MKGLLLMQLIVHLWTRISGVAAELSLLQPPVPQNPGFGTLFA